MKNKLIKIWKNVFAPFALALFIMGIALTVIAPVYADGVSSVNSANSATTAITAIGAPTALPSYQTMGHANAAIQPGATTITSVIYYAIDLVKYLIGTIAIVTIIISGVKLVTSGAGAEEEAKKQKEHLKFAIIGLVVIISATQFVQTVFFGQAGEIFSSQSTLQQAAQTGTAQIKGIYEIVAYFCGGVAILEIVLAGFKYITSGGNETTMGTAKRSIIYAVIGLMIVGIAEFAVKDVIFPQTATVGPGVLLPDINKTNLLIVNITNFISGFIATVAAVMYMYGGYIYVTAMGNQDATGKAKKVFIGATVGLFLAMAAFGIVNTTVKLENQIGPAGTSPISSGAASGTTTTTTGGLVNVGVSGTVGAGT
jgi:lysylphosphatidylglycerol synthetase-like protein (DUF2156 family)